MNNYIQFDRKHGKVFVHHNMNQFEISKLRLFNKNGVVMEGKLTSAGVGWIQLSENVDYRNFPKESDKSKKPYFVRDKEDEKKYILYAPYNYPPFNFELDKTMEEEQEDKIIISRSYRSKMHDSITFERTPLVKKNVEKIKSLWKEFDNIFQLLVQYDPRGNYKPANIEIEKVAA